MWKKIFTESFMKTYNSHWKYPLLAIHMVCTTNYAANKYTFKNPGWYDYVFFSGMIMPAMVIATEISPLTPLIGIPLAELWYYSAEKRNKKNN